MDEVALINLVGPGRPQQGNDQHTYQLGLSWSILFSVTVDDDGYRPFFKQYVFCRLLQAYNWIEKLDISLKVVETTDADVKKHSPARFTELSQLI